MPSSIRHIVEPAVGWLFVIVVIIIVCAALLGATQTAVEVSGNIQVERPH